MEDFKKACKEINREEHRKGEEQEEEEQHRGRKRRKGKQPMCCSSDSSTLIGSTIDSVLRRADLDSTCTDLEG
jgi:hypothetical protein